MQDAPYREVPLRGRHGAVGLVDPEDYEWAMSHRWYRVGGHGGCFYVGRQDRSDERAHGRFFTMHRELLGLRKGDGVTVDHINGNGLDNRRLNLDPVTQTENIKRIHGRTDSPESLRYYILRLERNLAQARRRLARLEGLA